MSGGNASPGFWTSLRRHLNFFRIHLLFFTFTPLIFSIILYASNGRYPIAYIDALYNSVSAVTVCGLGTVNLSQLTPWQQTLLFIQMCVGSPVIVSWFMVYIRRHFFARKFKYIIQAEAARRSVSRAQVGKTPELASATGRSKFAWRVASLLHRRNGLSPVAEESASEDGSSTPREKVVHRKFRTDMIRRMDAPPKRVNPSGWISEGMTPPPRRFSNKASGDGGEREKGQSAEQLSSPVRTEPSMNLPSSPIAAKDVRARSEDSRVPSNATFAPRSTRPASSGSGSLDLETLRSSSPPSSPTGIGMRRTTTVEFAPAVARHYVPLSTVSSKHGVDAQDSSIGERPRTRISRDSLYSRRCSQVSSSRDPSQHATLSTIDQTGLGEVQPNPTDFGGFPMPHKLLGMLFWSLFPRTANQLRRTVTIPTTTALAGGELGRIASISGGTGNIPEGSKPVPYISFDAIVGHNSAFQMLTNEQLEELGGVEYRGLNALLWLVALYHFGCQFIAFAVIAPYMTMPKWAKDFVPPALIRPVATPWFSLFQVVSSYTNTGFSLVDQSMVPFQTAYPMIVFMILLVLAGNTGFPIFLRFMIWTIAKLIPARSRLYETLRFLLDHPRRCFVYLFPAHQTWFLLSILVLLNSIDFFCFMVLDIGNSEIESIPLGTRFVAGLLQAVDVRAAGFAVVPIAALAPAVKVMYVIMMYISVYPIAMSVRSTNVYEEQSLGIFHTVDQMSVAEQAFKSSGSRMAMWGHYLAMHARYQLSYDMWWLALALFLVCIIERDNLINPEIQGWFNIFSIVFELVSAYGSVGLSLGIPGQNYSLSGAFRPLSKLIVCLVMIRGRHRGLPVAIDRAIVLPYEFERAQGDSDPSSGADERQSSLHSGGAVSHPDGGSVEGVEHGQTILVDGDEVGGG